MADTAWEQLNKRMKQLQKRLDIMDESEKLANLVGFHLTDYSGKNVLDNVVNITSNKPVTFAEAVRDDLLAAKWQVVVEGEVSSKQAHDIEQFIEDSLDQANEFLLNEHGIPTLDSWLANHVCVRSLIGVRWMPEVVDGNYKIDCLPVDMRWCGWPFGFNWVAPLFFKNSDEFMDDPDFADSKPKLIQNTDYAQVDYWSNDSHEVWVVKGDTYDPTTAKGTRIFEEENPFKEPPFVIVLPASGFMLRGKGWIESMSPDIFWPNRNLYKELNRMLSIEQTRGMDILYPPYEREVESTISQPSKPVPKSGESLDVKKGERHIPVPRGDWSRASLTAREDILNLIDLGGISDMQQGQIGPNTPGVVLARLSELKHKKEKVRFDAVALMKSNLMRLNIRQILSLDESGDILVGKTGRRNKFNAKMLGDPDKYTISFKPLISSKEMEMVNISVAQASRGIVPEKIIIRDILQAEDPDEWDRMLELDKAKAANPAIGLLEMSVRYAEEAEELEDEGDKAIKVLQSKILLHDYVMMMRARLQPPQPEEAGREEKVREATEVKPNMQGLMSMPKMLGAGGLDRGTPPPQQEVTE